MKSRNEELMKRRIRNIPKGTSNTYPSFIKEARGAIMIDEDGRKLIDFGGGIGVNNVGHCHPKLVSAIKDQADKFIHTCFMVAPYASYVDLAERLNDLAPGDFDKMTMFANSGAEAVENAVKIARYATGKSGIISLDNAFHGRTLLSMTLTSKIKPYKHGFGPFAPEIYRALPAYCYRCPLGLKYPKCNTACADNLESLLKTSIDPEQTAAIIAEPIQGEGGFITPPPEYFAKMQNICRKYGILFIADEIQTGMGRTAKIFAIDHWGAQPDIIITSKSLAGGLPLSAITGRSEIMNKIHEGGLGGTFNGNPVACSAALAVLEILIEDGLLTCAAALGEKLYARLRAIQANNEIIGDVRGKGPMLAMELVKDRETREPAVAEAKKLVKLCYEKGLIILSCGIYGNVIRFLMPLVISDEELENGLTILEESLHELSK